MVVVVVVAAWQQQVLLLQQQHLLCAGAAVSARWAAIGCVSSCGAVSHTARAAQQYCCVVDLLCQLFNCNQPWSCSAWHKAQPQHCVASYWLCVQVSCCCQCNSKRMLYDHKKVLVIAKSSAVEALGHGDVVRCACKKAHYAY